MRILQKWTDIKLPLKGLIDLIPSDLLDGVFSPNLQNMELDEGVVRSRKGYKLNSMIDVDAYEVGTVISSLGSFVVSGVGTVWTDALVGNSFTNKEHPEKSYLIDSVESNTALTLKDAYTGETTKGKLAEDANYATTYTPTTMCWDGTNHWAIVDVSGVYKVRKYDAVMTPIGADIVIQPPILYPTGITEWNGNIWVAGKDDNKQYLVSVSMATTRSLGTTPYAPQYGTCAVSDGVDNIYIIIQKNGDKFGKYNISSNTWTNLADTLSTMNERTKMCYDGSDKIFLMSFYTLFTAIWVYTISTNLWALVGDPYPSDPQTSEGFVYLNGYIYLSDTGTRGFHRYNTNTDTWEVRESLPSYTTFSNGTHLQAATDGEYLYFITSQSVGNNNVFRYNPVTNAWEGLYDVSIENGYMHLQCNNNFLFIYFNPITGAQDEFRKLNLSNGAVTTLDMSPNTSHIYSYSHPLVKLNNGGIWCYFAFQPNIYLYDEDLDNWSDRVNLYALGDLGEEDTPQLGDITSLSGSLWGYAGFWDTETNSFTYELVKFNSDFSSYDKYGSPSLLQEFGLETKGTNLICRVKKFYRGYVKDYIYEIEPIENGLIFNVVAVFDTQVVHDEGLGTHVRGISHDGTNFWTCQNTDTTTIKFVKYLATVAGDSYTISGVTDNLFNFIRWDGSETLVWSTIPKGKVVFSFNAKEWDLLKIGLNSNYNINFVTYMNYVFASNGSDNAWCWDGNDKEESTVTANGSTTTLIDTAMIQADDFWNGCMLKATSGTNEGESTVVTDFDAATDTFTFAPAFSVATATGDTYSVIHTVDNPNEFSSPDIVHNGALPSMPKGGLLAVFQNRLFTTDKDHPNILRCSGLYFGQDSGMTGTWDALQQWQIANEDRITGLYTAGDRLYIFAEKHVYIMLGSGSFASFQIVKLEEPVGLISDRGAVVKDNTATFCGRDGIYKIVGREIQKLSDKIKKFITSIQQTQTYWEFWNQSSEAEFNDGDYNSDEISVKGGVELKTQSKLWSTGEGNWGDAIDSEHVGTGSGVALLEDTGNPGAYVDDSYLSGNIAGQLSITNRMLFGSGLGTIDDNYATYSYGRSTHNGYKMFGMWYSFGNVKNIRKIKIRFTLHNHENWMWGTTFKVMYNNGTGGNVLQYQEVLYTHPGDLTLNRTIEVPAPGLDIKRLWVTWESEGSDMAVSFTEMEVFEWVTEFHYETIGALYSSGFIIMQHDSTIVNPLWGKMSTEYLQTFEGYSTLPFVKLLARTSPDGTTWDDNSWVTFGEMINDEGVLKSKGGTPDLPRQRHIQVKVELLAYLPWSPYESAVINQLSIEYKKNSTGVYTSTPKLLSNQISDWDVFETKQILPTESYLKYEVTSATTLVGLDTSDWVELPPNTKPQIGINPSGNTYFKWRVTLSTNKTASPIVSSVTQWWLEGGVQVTPMCSIMYNNKYYLSVAVSHPDSSYSRYNNVIIVINKEGNFEKIVGLNVSGFTVYKDRLYGGASDSGFLYLLEEGHSDNEKEIDAYVETADYNFNYEFRKNVSNNYKNLFQVYCEGRTTAENIFIGYSFDGGQTWEDVEVIMNELKGNERMGDLFKVRRYVPFGKQGKIVRFRVKGNTLTDYIEVHSLRAFIKISPVTGE